MPNAVIFQGEAFAFQEPRTRVAVKRESKAKAKEGRGGEGRMVDVYSVPRTIQYNTYNKRQVLCCLLVLSLEQRIAEILTQ